MENECNSFTSRNLRPKLTLEVLWRTHTMEHWHLTRWNRHTRKSYPPKLHHCLSTCESRWLINQLARAKMGPCQGLLYKALQLRLTRAYSVLLPDLSACTELDRGCRKLLIHVWGCFYFDTPKHYTASSPTILTWGEPGILLSGVSSNLSEPSEALQLLSKPDLSNANKSKLLMKCW